MPRGGKRKGAGRPPNAQRFESQISAADRRIAANLIRYIENMEQLADGVTVQEVNQKGDVIVYTRAPDRAANEYLLNRIMGKPVERTEVDLDAHVSGGVAVYIPDNGRG